MELSIDEIKMMFETAGYRTRLDRDTPEEGDINQNIEYSVFIIPEDRSSLVNYSCECYHTSEEEAYRCVYDKYITNKIKTY